MLKHAFRNFILLAVGLLLVCGIYRYKMTASDPGTRHAAVQKQKKIIVNESFGESEASLQSQLSGLFTAYPNDTISVCLINLGSNNQFAFGSSGTMVGASTTKVIVAADYLNQVELGKASLGQSLDDDGDSAQSLMQTMIEESDVESSDDAWQDFINYLSSDQITDYGQSIGLSSFNSDSNTITAQDEAIILQKLFEGSLLNKSDTDLLLGYLQNSAGQDLISAGLPSGAVVYHKYGYLYGYLNDAAIVTYKGKSFVLSIYTNNSSGTLADNTSREQLFHAITQDVIKYES